MRKFAPIQIKLYLPSNESAAALAKATAEVHATAVIDYLKTLNCSSGKKAELLDSIVQIK